MKTYNQQHNVNAKQLKKQSKAFRKLRMQKGNTFMNNDDKDQLYDYDNAFMHIKT
jgi:hypothetical protein